MILKDSTQKKTFEWQNNIVSNIQYYQPSGGAN